MNDDFVKRGQNPRHHHRTSRERQSIFMANHELMSQIITEIYLKIFIVKAKALNFIMKIYSST